MTKPTVYVETSVISYLVGRPSKSAIVAGHQASTAIWWRDYRRKSQNFISKAVWDEILKGDSELSDRRQNAVSGLPWLQIRKRGVALAEALIVQKLLPPNAEADALHIGVAADHAMKFVLTWNFTHIANASSMEAVRTLCTKLGLKLPIICSPEQFVAALPYEE